ncbi:MAG: hypothetical protein RIQ99_886 [Pseudomonadota bacterium]|jgi:uncharacterized membrane protein
MHKRAAGGWLVLLALVPSCHGVPIDERRLVAIGTEPFWSIEISPGEVTYATPDNLLGSSAPARRVADRSGVTWTAQVRGQHLELRVEVGACNDGVSDFQYPYRASLRLGAATRSGCARHGPPHS